MKCEAIIKKLEELAPTQYAEQWDNVGLLVGSKKKQVKKILIALDATDSVIEQAVHLGADMLITHHPMIFSGMKRINDEDFIGRRVISLIQNDISYYAMHTNCDVCVMNDVAAEKIGLIPEDILEVVGENNEGDVLGIGKIGILQKEVTVKQLAEQVKQVFGLKTVRVTGELEQEVKKVAISTGAGKSMSKLALKKGAQVIITGDMDHHSVIDALAQGMQVIDAGHYGTEHFMVEYIEAYLNKQFGDELEIYQAIEKEPFSTL